jgi:hypothetical protein
MISRRPVVRFTAAVAAGTVLVGCGGRRDAQVVDAELLGDRTLVLQIDACNADENRVSITEEQDLVTISVSTDDPPGGDDCGDLVTVELADPLGDRILVDEKTGEPVGKRPAAWWALR